MRVLPRLDCVQCTTPLEVRLLAQLIHERHLRERLEQLLRKQPEPVVVVPPDPVQSRQIPPEPLPDAPAPIVETMEPDHLEAPRVRQSRLDRLPGGQAKIIDIQQAVCQKFGYTITDLRSQRRTYNLAQARHVAVMLCYALTMHSYPFIGRFFGNRDHTTMLHSVTRLEDIKTALCSELTTNDSVNTWVKHAYDLVMAGRAKAQLEAKQDAIAAEVVVDIKALREA